MDLMEKYRRKYKRGQAEPFDPSLYENARERLYAFMTANEGRWLTRTELRAIGGDEAMRRVREIRDDYGAPIEMRHVGHSQYEYRMLAH